MKLIELNLQRILDLCRKHTVKTLSVFGSILTDRFNEQSDVELLVNFGEYFRHLSNGHRRAHARNNVFALRVGKEFAHKPLFARSGITRKRNARSAVVAHVAERHHLHVDRRTPAVRNVVVHTVDVRAGVVSRTEHRFDRFEQLFFRIGREFLAELLFVFFFKLIRKFF